MSKYYGESERLLGKVFSLANEIPNGAIIFLDEVLIQISLPLLCQCNTCENVSPAFISSSFILCSDLQVDSFAVTRDNEMHEATRRILSVLLRQV